MFLVTSVLLYISRSNQLIIESSCKKLHRQKGTGGARKGNLRNPLYKGGGTVFGPKPRDYDFKLNAKVKGLAKVSALSYKVKENNLLVVEDLKIATPKTKDFISVLKALNADNKKVLFLAPEENENLHLSFRNLPNVQGYQFTDMNTYDIVNADVVVITESTVNTIAEDVKEVSAN